MALIATNWENDMIAEPEEKVIEFMAKYKPNYELKLLSGLRHRDMEDIKDSLENSRIVIMQPSLLEKEQVVNMVKNISHPIHVNLNGSTRNYEIRDFIFLSSHPFEDLTQIKEWCNGVKDGFDSGDALTKILSNCEIHFYGFDGEHYEMKRTSYLSGGIYAARYK
jgi:hypothetical protein